MNNLQIISWETVFNGLNTLYKGFDRALTKQFLKKRIRDNEITIKDCISRVSGSDVNSTVALDVSKLDPPLIGLDIDNSTISKQILDLLLNEDFKDVFEKAFGNPLLVYNTSSNHLHLYYKARFLENLNQPVDSSGRVREFKKTATTRLGFECEYVYQVITFAACNRQVVRAGDFPEISELPYSLYPYNYSKTVKPLVSTQGTVITEGHRNQLLFEFFVKDNFKFDHLKVANQLCCQSPLDDKELETLTNLAYKTARRNPENEQIEEQADPKPSSLYATFSWTKPNPKAYYQRDTSYRLRPGEKPPTTTYRNLTSSGVLKPAVANSLEDLGFNPDRADQALKGRRTLEQTLCYLALFESTVDTFLDDELWIGESLLGVATLMLLKLREINIVYILNEDTYYNFNGLYWAITSEDQVTNEVTRSSQRLCKFQNISNLTDKKAILSVIREHSSFESWPHRASGFNFLNGSLIATTPQTVELTDHNADYYFRRLIKTNYDPNVSLSMLEGRFLLDFTNESVYLLNVIRLILYCCFESGGNQVAAFIMGAAGGSKSTLFAIIDKLVVNSRSITNINSLTSKFGLLPQIKGQSVLLVDDLAEDSINNKTAAVLKKIIAGNAVNDEVKYSGFSEFVPNVFLLFASNFDPIDFECFKDQAFSDRVLVTPAASIHSTHRVNDYVEKLSVLTNNFAGLTNWVIQQTSNCMNQINRAADLNSVIYPSKTLIDSFTLEKLIYEEGNFLSNKDLSEAYNSYASDTNKADEGRSAKDYGRLSSRKFTSAFRELLKRLDKSNPIEEKQTREARGFKNVNFKDPSGSLSENQHPLQFASDPAAAALLSQDPFFYAGPLIRDQSKSFTQYPSLNRRVELASKIAVKATENYSSKMLIDKIPFKQFKPHSHITASVVQTGPKIHETETWAQIPSLKLENELEPTEISTNQIFKGIEQYLENNPEFAEGSAAPNPKSISLPVPEESIVNLTSESVENLSTSNNEDGKEPEPITKAKQEGSSKPRNNNKINLDPGEEQILNSQDLDEWDTFSSLLNHNLIKNLDKSELGKLKANFNQALINSKNNLTPIVAKLKQYLVENNLKEYQTFTEPYQSTELIKQARDIFTSFPLYGPVEFIQLLNETVLNPVIRAFNLVRHYREHDEHSYFARSLPGTNNQPAQAKNLKSIVEDLTKSNPIEFSPSFDPYQWGGRSLLPLIYQPGQDSYGRLKPVPSSSLSNLKQTLKTSVLKVSTDLTGVQFVELDLKSCHTLIFKDLVELNLSEEEGFPTLQNHWNSLVSDFKNILNFKFPNFELNSASKVREWDDNQIKALVKVQWYKALNGGNLFNPTDNLKNIGNRLGITNAEQPAIREVVQSIFQEIPLFKILGRFQTDVNRQDYIYLPTQAEAFSTKTLSKKQMKDPALAKGSKGSSYGMTGMSRIFSSCELVLIFFVFIALEEIPDVIPLSYEADGLLLAGKFKDQEGLLKQLNSNFSQLVKPFMKEDFALEFKNMTSLEVL